MRCLTILGLQIHQGTQLSCPEKPLFFFQNVSLKPDFAATIGEQNKWLIQWRRTSFSPSECLNPIYAMKETNPSTWRIFYSGRNRVGLWEDGADSKDTFLNGIGRSVFLNELFILHSKAGRMPVRSRTGMGLVTRRGCILHFHSVLFLNSLLTVWSC